MKTDLNILHTQPAQTNKPHTDIAQRLKTLESSEAYLSELQNLQATHANSTPFKWALNSKMEEVSRAVDRHRLQRNLKTATAAIANAKTEAASAIKAAQNNLAEANNEHAQAVQVCAAIQARMAPLSDRIQELHQQAAQRVQAAQARFDAVMLQANTDEAAELKASQALIEAQQSLATSGAAESLRLNRLAQQMQALEAAEQAAAQTQNNAVEALNQALAMQALAAFDAVSLAVLEAYFLTEQARARPGSAVPGWRFPDTPTPCFTQMEHAPCLGEKEAVGGKLSAFTVSRMAQTFKPINLALLAAPLPVADTGDNATDADADAQTDASERQPDHLQAVGSDHD